MKKTLYKISLLALALLLSAGVNFVHAQMMSSTNYGMESDSINVGGNLSSSASYQLEDTAGESATGRSASASYEMRAGYPEMREGYISISSSADVVLSPSIGGLTGGTGNGSTTITVTTDAAGGYQLSIKASSSPALISGTNSFANYTPATADPDFTFSIAAADSEFGFSPEGTDIVAAFLDNGSACNTGALDTADACWKPILTTNTLMSQGSASNHPTGTETKIKFRAQSGSSHLQVEGEYAATTTVTAISL